MTVVDHATSSVGERDTKMMFPVVDDPTVGSETMWVENLRDGTFRLRNIPGWATGLAAEDVVAARQQGNVLAYTETIASGGHSTYRLALQQPDPTDAQSNAVEKLRDLGCAFEKLSNRVLAVDVPRTPTVKKSFSAATSTERAGACHRGGTSSDDKRERVCPSHGTSLAGALELHHQRRTAREGSTPAVRAALRPSGWRGPLRDLLHPVLSVRRRARGRGHDVIEGRSPVRRDRGCRTVRPLRLPSVVRRVVLPAGRGR